MYATKLHGIAKRLVPVVRVSSPRQELGTSLATQRRMIEEFAQRNNFELITKEDGSFWCENKAESAWGKKDRADFERAFKLALQPQCDGMLVFQIDRFSREGAGIGLMRIEKLKNANKHLVSVTEPEINTTGPAGQLVMALLLATAKFSNDMRAASAARGQGYLKDKNIWIGGTVGYGWKKKRAWIGPSKSGHTRYSIVPNEDELVWIDVIVNLHKQGVTNADIAQHLNDKNAPTRKGIYKWKTRHVFDILRAIRNVHGDPIPEREPGQHYFQWGDNHMKTKRKRRQKLQQLAAEAGIEIV